LKKNSSGFSLRSFISLASAGLFLLMTVTGVVLYIEPQGRVAYWVGWRFWGLSKTDWGNIHIVSSLFFAVAAGVHLWLNWKAFWNYLTARVQAVLRHRRELAAAAVLTAAVFFLSLFRVAPVSWILDLGEAAKASWVKDKSYEPPFGHAELVGLKVLCKKSDLDWNAAAEALKAAGIRFASPDALLKDVAAANGMTPREVFRIMQDAAGKKKGAARFSSPDEVEEKFAGTGVGRRKLAWLADDLGLDMAVVNRRLARAGIRAKADATLKDIAAASGYPAMELLKAILIEGYEPARD